MKKIDLIIFSILMMLLSHCLWANEKAVRISDVTYRAISPNLGKIIVKYKGKLQVDPILLVKNNIVQLAFSDAIVWPKIEKKITVGKQKFDTTLMAYQYDKNLARVRLILPYHLQNKDKKIKLLIRQNEVEMEFPKLISKKSDVWVRDGIDLLSLKREKTKDKKKGALKYDETYLDNLLKDKKEAGGHGPLEKGQMKDEVKTKLSSNVKDNDKKDKKDFSLINYIIKFAAFLGLVLILFYFIVTVLKKGVLKKGRLGFLNKTETVTVLNTTYIGPKKSLVMVKVHNQAMLLGVSENGINYLTEINDLPSLIKNGEKELAGDNFDTSLVTADKEKKQVKLKEDENIVKADVKKNEEVSLDNFLKESGKQKKGKFSEHIKKRFKNLKSLQ